MFHVVMVYADPEKKHAAPSVLHSERFPTWGGVVDFLVNFGALFREPYPLTHPHVVLHISYEEENTHE